MRTLQQVRFRLTDKIIKDEMTTAQKAVVFSKKAAAPHGGRCCKMGRQLGVSIESEFKPGLIFVENYSTDFH